MKAVFSVFAGLLGLTLAACHDSSPSTPYTPPPPLGYDTPRRDVMAPKPLPPQDPPNMGPIPYADEPLLVDRPPEAKAYVDIYRKVGRPRIVVFVNRSLEGRATAAEDTGEGRAELPYLKPGQYDELNARRIDYALFETQLADWMSADNQVTIMSPAMVHQKLTDEQERGLTEGRVGIFAEVAKTLDADVLIQVQARPTKQTPEGLELRMLADVVNLRGGESLARGAVDVYPPFDKYKVNRYTRFLARKLMDGMTQTWATPADEQPKNTAVQPKPEVVQPNNEAVQPKPEPAKKDDPAVVPAIPPGVAKP